MVRTVLPVLLVLNPLRRRRRAVPGGVASGAAGQRAGHGDPSGQREHGCDDGEAPPSASARRGRRDPSVTSLVVGPAAASHRGCLVPIRRGLRRAPSPRSLERRVGLLDRALGRGVAGRAFADSYFVAHAAGSASSSSSAASAASASSTACLEARLLAQAVLRRRGLAGRRRGRRRRRASARGLRRRPARGAPARVRRAPCAPRARGSTRASRRRRSAACGPRRATVRVPTASSSARSWVTSSSEPGKALQRVLERLAALEVEVVRRLVEDQHVGAGLHEDRQRQALALAAAEAVERLLGLLAAEQERARAASAPGSASGPVRLTAASRTVRAPPHSSSSPCWER